MARKRRSGAKTRTETAVEAKDPSSSGRSGGRNRTTAEGSGACGASKPAPGLYVTATPIGNLADISFRAIEVMRAADLVVCEDTRVTGKLLSHYGIATPMLAYYDHNAAKVRPRILARLGRGEVVVLVSDAGTPLVSDPGYKLVAAALAAGVAVLPVPGPSAVTAALSIAGLPTDRFLFVGYLPGRRAARRKELVELRAWRATLVALESPRRLPAALADMAEVLGPRPAAVAREMTKRFEEVRRGTLAELAALYRESGPPKGEAVVVVGPAEDEPVRAADIDAALEAALATMGVRDAAALVATATGAPRREVYARALALGRRS